MKIIEPSYRILDPDPLNGIYILKQIERAGRICYKSEDKITDDSCAKFVKMLVERGHHAMIEHGPSISVEFICNRGFSHELIRSRLCSYAQESTRYCNYSKDKYDNGITFIIPPFLNKDYSGHMSSISKGDLIRTTLKLDTWKSAMCNAEEYYLRLIKDGAKPQEARGVLPIDVKTEIVIKCNIREWRHIFTIRTANAAHPSMQQLMRPLLKEFQEKIPILFDDIKY